MGECFDFIKENCFIRRKSEDDRPLMYTCGIGGFQYGKKIEDSLNVRYLRLFCVPLEIHIQIEQFDRWVRSCEC